jgi:hypothetical protein
VLDISTTLLLLALFVLILTVLAWQFIGTDYLLQKWAKQNSYRLVDSSICWVDKGPFFGTTGRDQLVYYVIVQGPDGKRQSAWVRCGGFLPGLLTNRVEVEWNREPAA